MENKHVATTQSNTLTTTINTSNTTNTATAMNMKFNETLDPEIFLKDSNHWHFED
jgi:hypothetical protein